MVFAFYACLYYSNPFQGNMAASCRLGRVIIRKWYKNKKNKGQRLSLGKRGDLVLDVSESQSVRKWPKLLCE